MTGVRSATMRIRRRPGWQHHEAALQPSRRGRRRAGAWATAALASVCISAGLFAACGGSSAGPASPSPAGPTPQPSPQITSGAPPHEAVSVVRRFWTLIGEGRTADALDLTTRDSDQRLVDEWGIASARFIGVVPHSVSRGPLPAATIEFAVKVFIDPADSASGGQWGDARAYQLFEHVVRMSDGSWRLVASGTGP